MPQSVLVMPCFNEADRLDAEALTAYCRAHPHVAFVLVDDGSTDETRAVLNRLAEAAPQSFRVVGLDKNGGKAEAVRQGVLAAAEMTPSYVGYWDADLATPLQAIKDFEQILEANADLQLVMGARIQLLGRSIRRSMFRHYVGRVFATVASRLLCLPVYDTQCGAKLFRADAEFLRLFNERWLTRWLFDVEMLARLSVSAGARANRPTASVIYELPLDRWHDVAGSKVRGREFLRAGRETVAPVVEAPWRLQARQPEVPRMIRPPLHPHVGWVSWIVLYVAIVIVLANDADRRGVSHVYEQAAHQWIESEPLYVDGYKGFLYPPQSAAAYVPFLFPNDIVGSFLWRLLGLGLLAAGVYRLNLRLSPEQTPQRFTIATALLIPVAISSLRNGQSNLHLAGVLLHATVAWMDGRRAATSLWIFGGLLAKPLALVFLLLAGAAQRALIIGFIVALVVFALVPYLHAEPDYVTDQLQAFVEKSKRSSDPEDHVYANVAGILAKAGVPLPRSVRRPVQILAALATLGIALWARRRVSRGVLPFVVMTLAALYLMLFNPRNEANSFVLLGTSVAILGAIAWTSPQRQSAWLLTAVAIGLGIDNYGRWLHGSTGRWFKPAVALVFLFFFLRWIAQAPKRPLLPLRPDNPPKSDRIPA